MPVTVAPVTPQPATDVGLVAVRSSTDVTRPANSSHSNTTCCQFGREFIATEGPSPGTRGRWGPDRHDHREFAGGARPGRELRL